MAVSIAKTPEEIRELPLVELAWEILRTTREPYYFRDLMREIQALRNMTEEEVNEVIARLYTEINIDGRFVCIGQNVWGLKRWYNTEKTDERQPGKKFVRTSGDAFSEDDDLDDFEEEAEEEELEVLDDELGEGLKPDEFLPEEEELPFDGDEEEAADDLLDEEPLLEGDAEEPDEEEEF
ncbi:MAG: DNA-directed RNA polymerase subunit delta [Alicyclobacillus sp.]|nr:DNA-directed RNA polymerase subunit delta [Alicyclobacillus sp.]